MVENNNHAVIDINVKQESKQTGSRGVQFNTKVLLQQWANVIAGTSSASFDNWFVSLEVLVKLNNEVFGAAGAVWGFSEVMTWRTADNAKEWRIVAIIVGVLFLFRWARYTYQHFAGTRMFILQDNDKFKGAVRKFADWDVALAAFGSERTDEELTAVFKEIDTDGSGYLTAQELYDAMQKMGVECEFRSVLNMVDQADADRNGSVDVFEFITAMRGI